MVNPKYSDEVKTHVVQALASFDTPAVVAKSVKAEFDIVISPQASRPMIRPSGQGESSRRGFASCSKRPARPSSRVRRLSPSAIVRFGCALSSAWQRRRRRRGTWSWRPICLNNPPKEVSPGSTGAHLLTLWPACMRTGLCLWAHRGIRSPRAWSARPRRAACAARPR
ncbi:DUF2280 domain-containing protein [Sinorhizobium meliloti]|nr:DUF2280 domain-containing protein [Sinorhizobium meliloti]